MKNIIWQDKEGNIAITEICIDDVKSKDEAIKLLDQGNVPSDYKIVALDKEITADKMFFAAWRWDKKKKDIVINFAKAKEIAKERIGQQRHPVLAKLKEHENTAWMNNDVVTLNKISDKKEKLRTITDNMDSLKTLEELKVFVIPESLRGLNG